MILFVDTLEMFDEVSYKVYSKHFDHCKFFDQSNINEIKDNILNHVLIENEIFNLQISYQLYQSLREMPLNAMMDQLKVI